MNSSPTDTTSWIIVGAGSAGCVLANRLSADDGNSVTLLEAGPDLVAGAVPSAIAGPSFFAALAEPDRSYPDLLATRTSSGEQTVYQRGRGIGGSSAVNAMVALPGSQSLYDSWRWHDSAKSFDQILVPTSRPSPDELGAVDHALLAADDRAAVANLTRRDGQRVTAAEAYLWPALERPNLVVRPESRVATVLIEDRTAVGVRLFDGSELAADRVVVAGGAIHTPAILLRSGVDTPGIGLGLQDHPSAVFALQLKAGVGHDPATLPIGSIVHAALDDQLLQLLPMSHLGPDPTTAGLGALMVALMTPLGRAGTVTVDDDGQPIVDFALLNDERDMLALIAGVRLALDVLDRSAFHDIVESVFIDDYGSQASSLSSDAKICSWLQTNCADYVHASSTCAMGTVVDEQGAVIGYNSLFVCDASIFPTIPDANTHIPTMMAAERLSSRLK